MNGFDRDDAYIRCVVKPISCGHRNQRPASFSSVGTQWERVDVGMNDRITALPARGNNYVNTVSSKRMGFEAMANTWNP
jgi:hypothetical protein